MSGPLDEESQDLSGVYSSSLCWSSLILPSKEVWENMRSKIKENRKKDMEGTGVTMTYEVVGHIKAEGSS